MATSRGDRGRRDGRPPRRRSLGQHHLRDGRRAAPLVDFLRPGGRPVLEIGAGGGALTELLLERGAERVVAVELDPAWAFSIAGRGTGSVGGALSIVIADALEIAWERLPTGWRVAGNLPYNVGTALLERIVTRAPVGTRVGLLLQSEVVDRLVATPGSKAYGALSVLVAARASVVRLGALGPGAFVPPPRVESAFVGLELRAAPFAPEQGVGFVRTVTAAFGQRRKTLRNALGTLRPRAEVEAALARAGIDGGRRAETLGLEEFVALARALGAGG